MKSLASFSGKNANSSTSMKSTDLPRIEDDEDAAANILLPLSNPIVPFDQPPLSGLIPCCNHRGSFKIAERIRSIISNACDSLFARTAIVLSLLNKAYHKI